MSEEQQAKGSLGAATATAAGVTVSEQETPEVVDKGKGVRPEAAPGAGPAPKAPAPSAVTVSEDVDFEAVMRGAAREDEPAFEPGDKVTGVVEVVSLHGQEVFLDLGGKATGFILKEELRGADGELTVKQGDSVEGIVVGTTSHGVQLRVRLGADADSRALREAFNGGLPVEGKILGTNKGGYDVLMAGQRAFCPFSQIDVYRLEDPESVVGRTYAFRVTEMRPGSIVISRAAILRAEQAERAAETLTRLTVGAVLPGRVRSIQKFGVFVDLGGIDGLVPMSELSWERVGDAHQVVKLGDEVTVKVLEIDPARERIALSIKHAQGDPFEAGVSGVQVGDTVSGTVARLTNFGAFVTIAPAVDGLLHISDMAHHRVRHPKDILSVGDAITVKVTEIDLERRRIGLSLKALAADPWDDAPARYPVGKEVTGKIESVQVFGVFVVLEPGVTALLPASESNTPGQALNSAFRVGDEVTARILRVEGDERKIALTRREEGAASAGADLRRGGGPPRGDRRGPRGGDRGGPRPDHQGRGTLAYADRPDRQKGKGGKEVGSLGELLLAALGDKSADDDEDRGASR